MKKDDYIRKILEELPSKEPYVFILDRKKDEELEKLFVYMITSGEPIDVRAKRVIEAAARMDAEGFNDKRFNLPNRSHLKLQIMELYQEIIEKSKDANGRLSVKRADFFGKKIAIFIFDVEGLKAVNDNLSHAIGDRYLKLFVSKIFPRRNKKLNLFLEKYELDCFEATAGGDEMVLIVYLRNWKSEDEQSMVCFVDEKGQEKNLAFELLEIIQEDIEQINVLEKLGIELAFLKKKTRINMPDDFVWYAAAPGAYSTFSTEEWLDYFNLPEDKKRAIFGIMDAILTSAEKPMKEKKASFKGGLRKSGNLHDFITYEIIARNEEVRILLDELKEKDEIIKRKDETILRLVKKFQTI